MYFSRLGVTMNINKDKDTSLNVSFLCNNPINSHYIVQLYHTNTFVCALATENLFVCLT